MNDIERQLQTAKLAQPSDNLDHRMDTLFRAVKPVRPPRWLKPVPVWLLAAACLTCAAIGFGVRSMFVPSQPPLTTVYVVQPSEALRRVLNGDPPHRREGIDFSRAKIQVTTQPIPAGDKI